ncbi:MAG: D-cysteine desulfhydrase family protein [Gammaproteobacteria bacterium]|nr:D-cysteine desulfhydrase family protein [Gammaproteobacteria bacterium]MBQ0839041.1 D-cysteine desulfhydrase family protein [Gammaproteobacteria bacterium]
MADLDINYPESLALAQLPTPLQPLDRLSAQLAGPRIWVKRDDLTDCALSGNKIRKLEFTLAQALAQGCDTLITCGGVQSNHCRATAILGARLGLKVHLLLRDEGASDEGLSDNKPAASPDGNLLLDYLAGAEISIYPKAEFQTRQRELFAHWQQHYVALGRRPYLIPTGASDGTGIWGYIRCVEELLGDFKQAEIAPAHIVHATGSGGTQAGLSLGCALHQLDAQVLGIAVCDNAAYFQRKIMADISDWQGRYDIAELPANLSVQVNDDFIGPGYSKAGPEVFACIKKVAALEGLLLDPVYTGKAFHGMLALIEQGYFDRADDIVFVHTGGLFGLFAQREQLSF